MNHLKIPPNKYNFALGPWVMLFLVLKEYSMLLKAMNLTMKQRHCTAYPVNNDIIP